MEDVSKPAKIKTIRPETLEFIILYNQLKGKAFTGNAQLAEALGFNSPSSITEIVKSRQNIYPEKFRIFKGKYIDFFLERKSYKNTQTTAVNKLVEALSMYELSTNTYRS